MWVCARQGSRIDFSEERVVRAFIAIDLSPSIRSSIQHFQAQLQSHLHDAPVRWVPVGNIHLTLKFLGDIQPEQADPILRMLAEVATPTPVFDIKIRGFGFFPNDKRPRVLWIGVNQSGSQLTRLQEEIEQALLALNFEKEHRRFHPHLTLGRVKKSAQSEQVKSLSRQLKEVEQPDLGVQWVEAIHLIQSRLSPSGATYSPLGSAELERNR